ncbi:MAG: NAD(P)-dependent oxidoreductase [Myxococcales bacterium]|nr:NAD(P)-dependent oxidoreductase [Myxococcales bacterium]
MTSERIAFLGMGVMGAPMAANLARAGRRVTVWNRTPGRPGTALAREAGCAVADSIADAVRGARVVIACVSDAPDVEAVLLGPHGAAEYAEPGALFIDTSTIGPEAARAIRVALATKGVRFLDAPVSGGDVGARAGTLTFMVGGEPEDFDEGRPLFEIMGETVRHCGLPGAGQAVKLCNQVLCAAHMVGLSEAMLLAETQGIDPALVVDVCSTGAAGSWALRNLGPKVIARDYSPGFMIKDILKDLRLVRDAALAGHLDLPGAEFAREMFASTSALDAGSGHRWGTQGMIEAYRAARAHKPVSKTS